MYRLPASTVVLVAPFLLAPAAQAEPRQPIKPWVLDYGETSCTAYRSYGDPEKPWILVLRPSPRGNVMQLILMRPGYTAWAEHVPVTVKFGETPLETTGLYYSVPKGKHQVLRMNFDWQHVAHIRAAPAVEIRARNSPADGSFAVPGIAKVVAAMEECNRDLQAHWNIGTTGAEAFTPASPQKPLASYIRSEDYPGQAIRENKDGTVRITLMVDEKGALQDCNVEETSGIATLDAQTCIVLQERAKFHPATDASGKPVKSILSTSVRWVLR